MVNLVLIGGGRRLDWPLGRVLAAEPTPHSVDGCVRRNIDAEEGDAWLFWDAGLGEPDAERVLKALSLPGDVWHAGLRLGAAGKPGLIDFVQPTWILNRDADASIESTSWRVSLGACLVRAEVLRQMRWVRPEFRTLEGGALELGHRLLAGGVIVRNVPWLVREGARADSAVAPLEDELRFVCYRYGRLWGRLALARSVMAGYAPAWAALAAWRKVGTSPAPAEPEPFRRSPAERAEGAPPSVSILIPTVDRYPYLRPLLGQLRTQTVKPLEIIVVDQTQGAHRDAAILSDFADLPLTVLYLDKAGQCSSRNVGLRLARGEYILFLDDDIEVGDDFIERHLINLGRFGQEVSSGIVHEVGAAPLPKSFSYVRASDVFPMGNTAVRRELVRRCGLLDLAFDRGARADADFGIRVHLSGALMILDPDISVLHHRAPRGGLRTHRARVSTASASRRRVWRRHLPSATEVYLALHHFTPRQAREMLWIRVLSTFVMHGTPLNRALKILAGAVLLPHTLWHVRGRVKEARRMLLEYPQIPSLPEMEKTPGAVTAEGWS